MLTSCNRYFPRSIKESFAFHDCFRNVVIAVLWSSSLGCGGRERSVVRKSKSRRWMSAGYYTIPGEAVVTDGKTKKQRRGVGSISAAFKGEESGGQCWGDKEGSRRGWWEDKESPKRAGGYRTDTDSLWVQGGRRVFGERRW
jgi:hypothetical protein